MNKENKYIKAYTEEINRCFRCGLCKTVCPSYSENGLESSSPRGRVQFAKTLLTGETSPDAFMADRFLDCLNCMKCSEICPSKVRTDRIVTAARAELTSMGKLDPFKKNALKVLKSPLLTKISALAGKNFENISGISGGLPEKFLMLTAGLQDREIPGISDNFAMSSIKKVNQPLKNPKGIKAGYFIGCATNFLYPEVARATVNVLTMNGVEVIVPRGQVCCGVLVYSSGDFDTGKKLAQTNLSVFKGLGLDCIITDCSSCSAALKHDVPEILGAAPFNVPVYDLNEFLAGIIKIERPQNPVEVSVTYHDPCHLVRGQGIKSEPRDLIKSVPGIDFMEMKDSDTCCGGAGSFAFTHHELSKKIGLKKAENIRKTGAALVAVPCPSCRMQIDYLKENQGLNVRTIHPVQLLEASYMGVMENFDEEIMIQENSNQISKPE